MPISAKSSTGNMVISFFLFAGQNDDEAPGAYAFCCMVADLDEATAVMEERHALDWAHLAVLFGNELIIAYEWNDKTRTWDSRIDKYIWPIW